jgi:CO/xanthine dehydrogenase Mo-binding subunit
VEDVFDAGTILNSDRVRAHLEGAVIFGMSLALYGGITMKGGAIEQDNFRGGGRIVRINEAPRHVSVDLVESTAAPGASVNQAFLPEHPPSRRRYSRSPDNGFASYQCPNR